VFAAIPLFLVFFFFGVVFLGGLEAVNPGQVHGPQAAIIIVPKTFSHCLVIGVVFQLSHNFVMKMDQKGKSMRVIWPNPNPK